MMINELMDVFSSDGRRKYPNVAVILFCNDYFGEH